MDRVITQIPLQKFPLNVPWRKRAGAYVRVSSGKEAMLHSLSAQVSYYSSYIQRKGWEYVKIYTDEAVTGTKNSRSAFREMVEDARAGKLDIIITKSITRFARNTLTLLETVRELRQRGVDIFFEKENIHTMSADGELLLTILASYAQEESRSVSENVKWRLRKNFQDGKSNNFTVFGYGVRKGEIVGINEVEAAIVRRIFTDYLDGLGMTLIANILNTEGYTTKTGVAWTAPKVRAVLKNEKYAGDLLMQKSYVADHLTKKSRVNRGELPQYLVTDNHEAIIPRADFEDVQQQREDRAKKYAPVKYFGEPYQFTGIITCGICGKNYRRKQNNAGTKYQKAVWICTTYNTAGKAACASKQIPETALEQAAAGFGKEVRHITALPGNLLRFEFADGSAADTHWQDHSRRDSWTDEMRQTAREHALKGRRLVIV